MINDIRRTFDVLTYSLVHHPRPDALADKVNGDWKLTSTREYLEYAEWLAMGLIAKNVKPGTRVGSVLNNCAEWNFLDMGLAMAGLVHVAVYPTISLDEYRYILKHAEIEYLVVGTRKLYERLKPLCTSITSFKDLICLEHIPHVTSFQDVLDLGKSRELELREKLEKIRDGIDPEQVASLIYTSGTTGEPKGVMLTHKNLVSNFLAHSKMHNLGQEHRVISFLPLCHVYERSVNYHFQYKGMGIYYVASLGQIVSAIREVKPHIFNSVPRLLERIYDGLVAKGNELTGIKRQVYFMALHFTRHFEYNQKLPFYYWLTYKLADKLVYSKWREALGGNLQYIVSGGAALQPRICRLLGMAGMYALEGYGLSETSPVIAVSNPAAGKMKVGTVGPVLDGVEVKIAEDGEILCKGSSVMKGYFKSPELTREVIDEEGWFHTGDIGLLEEGIYLKITDRKKEIFKMSGGKYIAPQLIENKLKESIFIEQAIVIGENQKFASALIVPNFDYLHTWCSKNHVHFQDNAELIQKKEVLDCINREVIIINKTLGQVEQIKRFRLVADEWTPQSGELSPTLKLKRNRICKKYRKLIQEIYLQQKDDNLSKNRLTRIPIRFDMSEFIRKFKN